MNVLQKISHFITAMNTFLGKAASFFLIVFMCVLSYEVIARYGFNAPTIWAHELAGYLLAFYLALTGPWLLSRGDHVSVDIVYARYSVRKKTIADIVSNLIVIFFFVVVFLIGIRYAMYAYSIGQMSHTVWGPPIWPVKFCIPLSAVLFILQAIANIGDLLVKLTSTNEIGVS